jgi:hypothetical protein
MDTTGETPETGQDDPAAISEPTPARRPDGLPVGRPFVAGAPSANPLGRPRDPFAALIREGTRDGQELVEFAFAVLRDDLDGRIADKAGLCDRLEVDAQIAETEAAKARDDGDVFRIATCETKARELRTRAKAMRSKLARKRKVAVPVKTRMAALEYLSNRGWGKPLERVDLTLGNPDGSPMGSKPTDAPGVLARLTAADMADLATSMGAVLDRASKREVDVTSTTTPTEE